VDITALPKEGLAKRSTIVGLAALKTLVALEQLAFLDTLIS